MDSRLRIKLKEIYKKTKDGSIIWNIEKPWCGQPYIYTDIIRIDKDNDFLPVELRVNNKKIHISFLESIICNKIRRLVLKRHKQNAKESLVKQFLEVRF